jgi:hypothetical protein
LETKKLFYFNHLTINPTMFMTQSYYQSVDKVQPRHRRHNILGQFLT